MTKILLVDIETSPNLGWTWAKYEQDVIEFEKDWHMLSFAWKWLGQSKTSVLALPDFNLYKKDKDNDHDLVKALWNLFDEADIIIAHNGDRFDIKKANTRFVMHGFSPPSPYKTIDTLKIARKYFRFDSNKLGDLGTYLKLGAKIETGGFSLWKRCMLGEENAWRKLKIYNRMDVVLLEKVYIEMRKWMNNHPNVGILQDNRGVCPVCGSKHLQKRGFGIKGNSTKVQRLQCQGCGAWTNESITKTKEAMQYVGKKFGKAIKRLADK